MMQFCFSWFTAISPQPRFTATPCTPSLCVQVSFGEVVSTGRALDSVLWGAKVELRPICPGLWLDLLPDSWQQETDMSKVSSSRDTPTHWVLAEPHTSHLATVCTSTICHAYTAVVNLHVSSRTHGHIGCWQLMRQLMNLLTD